MVLQALSQALFSPPDGSMFWAHCSACFESGTDCAVTLQFECENVLNDAALMEACGVGLSRSTMYEVMMVCKQLGEDPKFGVATVRFFGKVVPYAACDNFGPLI